MNLPEDEQDDLLDFAGVDIPCPICSEHIGITEYHSHLLDEHPIAYATMLATYLPNLSPSMMFDAMHPFYDGEEAETENTYEELLELCENIGYHRVGVEDHLLDTVAPLGSCNKQTYHHEITCPICLEHILEPRHARCIATCQHTFCSECIQTWFKEHKTCPVCKKDVTEVDQIASISSSSESPALSEGADDPMNDVRREPADSSSAINST